MCSNKNWKIDTIQLEQYCEVINKTGVLKNHDNLNENTCKRET